jgi:hypothetical protein
MADDARGLAALEGEQQSGGAEPDDHAPERRTQQVEEREQRQADRAVLGVEAQEPERLVEDPGARPQARSLAGLPRKGPLRHHG